MKTRGFDFVMYQTRDMARSRAFYEGILELTATIEYQDFYVEYDLPDGNTFALGRDPEAAFVAMGGIMFGVDDAEAIRKKAESLGGTYHKRYGNGEPCFTEWCTDPDGNAFGLHQKK